jgi:hypothetical protein
LGLLEEKLFMILVKDSEEDFIQEGTTESWSVVNLDYKDKWRFTPRSKDGVRG